MGSCLIIRDSNGHLSEEGTCPSADGAVERARELALLDGLRGTVAAHFAFDGDGNLIAAWRVGLAGIVKWAPGRTPPLRSEPRVWMEAEDPNG